MKINPKANMRLRARKWFEVSLIFAIILILGFFMAFQKFEAKKTDFVKVDTRVEMEDIPETEQSNIPPPPKMPTVPVESEDEDLMDDITIELTEIMDFKTFTPPPPPPVVEDEDIPVFLPMEQQPKIIGGWEQLQQLIKYPQIARIAGIEGKVTINVLVNEKGEPVKCEVLQSNLGNTGCNEAAIEAIMQLRFKPATMRNRPVKFWMAIPVKFQIKKG